MPTPPPVPSRPAATPLVPPAPAATGPAAPAPRSSRFLTLRRSARRWAHQLRRLLGIRRGLLVDGVYYKELTPESLTRALSRRGPGHKDYRVTFPDRSKMVVRCSRARVFADLMGPEGLDRLEPLLPLVRPGGRVLEFNAGTGYRAHWLSFVVGPSGGVVAIAVNPDDVAFAVKRYPRPNIAFERAENFGLAGETDGAFDAVVLMEAPSAEQDRRTLINELWRLTAPGGTLFVGGIDESDTRAATSLAAIARQHGAEVRNLPAPGRPDDLLLLKPRSDDDDPGPS